MEMFITRTFLSALLVAFLCTAQHVCDSSCKSVFFGNCFGCVLPNNPYEYVGNTLTLNCTALDANKTDGLYFTMKNDEAISMDYQRVISPDTLQLNMPVTANMSDVTIQCWYMYNGSTSPPELIGGQVLCVEYEPRDVSSTVEAIVHNWDNLTLTFDVGKYIWPGNINVGVIWTAGSANGWYYCSNQTNTECFLNKKNFHKSDKYYFNITVNNTKTDLAVVTQVSFMTKDIVQPAPVVHQKAEEASRQVNLTWEPPDTSHQFVYHITTESLGMKNWSTDDTFLNIKGLHPYSNYTFSVSVKSKQGGYWSTSKDIIIQTKVARPDDGANLTQGSFFYTIPCKNNVRDVYIYLKEPDKKYQNGPLKKYLISVESLSVPHSSLVPYQLNQTLKVPDLKCDTSYNFSISTVNEAGTSPASELRVPRVAAVKPPSRVLVEVNETLVQWETEDDTNILEWTIFWCRKLKQPFEDIPICEAEFDWMIVKGSAKSERVPLNFQDVNQDLVFGVSVKTADGYSPIHWHDCLYDINKDPWQLGEPELDSVEAKPSLGLTVSWSLNTCPEGTRITSYIINLCDMDSNICEVDKVPSSHDTFVKKNLEEGQNYSVRIQQVAVSNRRGMFSKPVFAVPQFIGLGTSALAGIVIGCLIFVVVVTCGVVFAVRFCRRKVGEREKVVIPETTFQDATDNSASDHRPVDDVSAKCSRSSSDSGHHSSGSPVQEKDENSDQESPVQSGISDITVPRSENCYSMITANEGRQEEQPSIKSSHDEGETNNGFQSDSDDDDDTEVSKADPYIKNEGDICSDIKEKLENPFKDMLVGADKPCAQTIIVMPASNDTETSSQMESEL